MYYYRFGYGSYEHSGQITLVHERQFTQEEIEKIAEEAFLSSYYRKKEISEASWLNNHFNTYDDFHNRGWHEPTFEILFDLDGWGSEGPPKIIGKDENEINIIDNSDDHYNYIKHESMFLEYLHNLGFQDIKFEAEAWVSDCWDYNHDCLTKRLKDVIKKEV